MLLCAIRLWRASAKLVSACGLGWLPGMLLLIEEMFISTP
jgi:hypothetical protein